MLTIFYADEELEKCDREENKRISLKQLLELTADPTILNAIGLTKFRELIIMYLKGGKDE